MIGSFTRTTPSPRSLKMAKFNLVKFLHPYGNMIIFCNCHLNLNNFQIFVIKQHLRKMLWVFKFKYDFIISYMSTVEDTRTKSMFIMHFGRHNN